MVQDSELIHLSVNLYVIIQLKEPQKHFGEPQFGHRWSLSYLKEFPKIKNHQNPVYRQTTIPLQI